MIKFFIFSIALTLSLGAYGDVISQNKGIDDWGLDDFQSSYDPKNNYLNISIEFIDTEFNGMGNVVGIYGRRISDALDGSFLELQYSRHFHQPSKSETQNEFDYDSYGLFTNQYFDLPETAEQIRFFARVGLVYEEKMIQNEDNEYNLKVDWKLGTTYNLIDNVADLRFQIGMLEEDFNASLGWNIRF